MAVFDEILGNDIIKKHFKAAVINQKVSHAYIVEGEKGCGKKMFARAFSKILQCENGDADACGSCSSCIQIDHEDHPDVIWVRHEKPNVISVSEIREQIVNTVDIKPYKGPYKIYIVDEAEKMNAAAQNAILKTLEEPPFYAVIFLLTTNEGLFLPTILSRSISFHVKPVELKLISRYMSDHYHISEDKADFYAAFSMGNPGKAIDCYASEQFNQMKDYITGLLKSLHQAPLYEIAARLKEAKQYKNQYQDIFDFMMMWYHDVLLVRELRSDQYIIFKEQYTILKKQAACLSPEGINRIFEMISAAGRQIYANVNAEAVMESLFFSIRRVYQHS